MDAKIANARREIKRGVQEIINEERIVALLKNYYEKRRNFLVKVGFDPTAPDVHLGAYCSCKNGKLCKFGATVQFLIGDFYKYIW